MAVSSTTKQDMTPIHMFTEESLQEWSIEKCFDLHPLACTCYQLLYRHLTHVKTIYLDIMRLDDLRYTLYKQDIDYSDISLMIRDFRKMRRHINKIIIQIVGDLYNDGYLKP